MLYPWKILYKISILVALKPIILHNKKSLEICIVKWLNWSVKDFIIAFASGQEIKRKKILSLQWNQKDLWGRMPIISRYLIQISSPGQGMEVGTGYRQE